MANNIQLGVGVVDNTKQGLHSVQNSVTSVFDKLDQYTIIQPKIDKKAFESDLNLIKKKLKEVGSVVDVFDNKGIRTGQKFTGKYDGKSLVTGQKAKKVTWNLQDAFLDENTLKAANSAISKKLAEGKFNQKEAAIARQFVADAEELLKLWGRVNKEVDAYTQAPAKNADKRRKELESTFNSAESSKAVKAMREREKAQNKLNSLAEKETLLRRQLGTYNTGIYHEVRKKLTTEGEIIKNLEKQAVLYDQIGEKSKAAGVRRKRSEMIVQADETGTRIINWRKNDKGLIAAYDASNVKKQINNINRDLTNQHGRESVLQAKLKVTGWEESVQRMRAAIAAVEKSFTIGGKKFKITNFDSALSALEKIDKMAAKGVKGAAAWQQKLNEYLAAHVSTANKFQVHQNQILQAQKDESQHIADKKKAELERWKLQKQINAEMDAEKKRREVERKAAIKSNDESGKQEAEAEKKRKKDEEDANREAERQFKNFRKSRSNAIDIQTAIDNERASRDKAIKTHSDRTVENINKEIAALKELRKAENDLDKAQGKKSRNARHDSDTNQRIKLLEQEAEAAKKSAEERKKAEKDATDAARRHAKSRREWIKKEKALMKKLGGVILRAFSVHQIIRFGQKIAETTGYFEQQQIALEGILGSATKARSVLNDIANFALKSPFTTKDLVGFTKQLSAFGVGYDDLFPTVTKLADISAGLGVDMSRIILAYGQVKSASVLRGQELRQFTEAGIPMVDALSKKFTELNGELVTTADVFELISERKVSFEMVSEVLSDMTAEGGQFYKMQEELTNTLTGQISKLKDMWNLGMRDIGKSGNGVLNGIVKLLQRMVKDALSFSVAIAAAFATPMLAKAIVHFKALSRLLRISFNSIKGIGAGIYGLAAGALALAITKVISSTTELKRAFEEIETSFRKETDKMISGLDSLAKKISKAKVGTKEFADAVDTLSTNYGDFVSDEVIAKLKAQDEISERLAKNFGETANNIREAIIELKKFQELEEKKETVTDMFLQEKTDGKVFRNWMRNNKLGTSDMTKDVFKSMYGRDARNNRELLDIWDELYDDAVTMFATGDDLSKEEFERIFSDMIKGTFPEISEEELLRVVSLGWQATSRNTGAGFNNLYDDLVDSQNRITNSDYYKLQKTFEDWTKEYKDSEDFVERQNNMEAAYFKALRESVVGKFGENDLTRALESAYGMQDGKVIATNFDNNTVNGMTKLLDEFESTLTDSKAKTWFAEARKLFDEGVEDKSDRAAIVSDRMEAHKYLTDEVVSGLWRQYIPNNKTYKSLREQIKSDYDEAKRELDSYVGDDPKDRKRKKELNKRIDALTILASDDFYAVDLTDKKGGRNKYERLRTTDFFDEWLSLITKAEDDMKKIVGVTGYTDELGNFVNELSKENYLKAFFKEGGNPFEDIFAKMTKAGITEFLPEFNQETLKNIFRDAGWEEGKEISIPDFKAMYETVVNTIGDQVIAGLKTKRDQYAKGTPERNSLEAEIDRWQEAQAKYVKTMTTRWGGDEIEKKINLAIKELTNIGSKLDDIKSQRSMYERISKSSNPLIAKNALPDVSGYFSDSRYTSAALRETLRLEGGAGIASTLVGERLKSLLNASSLNIDNLSALFEIIRDLEEQAGEKEITLADGTKAANSDQFKESTSKVVDIINKLVESILKEYDKLAQYKTGDLKISDEILQAAEDFKNALKEIEDTEKDPERAASMKLSATQQHYDKVLKSLGGSEMPDWIKTMFGKEGAFGGVSGSGRFMKWLSGGDSLLDMVIQGQTAGINKQYAEGVFGKVGSADAMQGAADKLAGAASGAAGSIAMVDAIIKAVYQAINAIVELGKGILEVDAKVNNKLNLRKGANGKLYDEDGNINIDDNYYKKQERRETSTQVLETIGNFNEHVMGGWEKLKSGDVFGAITETVLSIADLIGDIANVRDTKLRQQQDDLIRSNEDLARSIEGLEDALEDAAGVDKYDVQTQQIANLQQQKQQYDMLLALENEKKNGDSAKAQEYASAAVDAQREIDEIMDNIQNDVLGTADQLASTLTDPLVDAFRNGENAARAWRDAVKSYVSDVLKDILMTKVVAPKIQEILDQFMGDNTSSDDIMSLFKDEDKVGGLVEDLNEAGTGLIDEFNNLPDSIKDLIGFNSEQSSLSGGISGITEDTARQLEGLANSMLMQQIIGNSHLASMSSHLIATIQISWFNGMLEQAKATRIAAENLDRAISDMRNGIRPMSVTMV
jgi:hypothetical protein